MTSFSAEGYKLYGKECLKTLHYWPCKFVVYYEELPDFESPWIEYRPLYEIPGIRQFLDKMDTCDGNGLINGVYDYRFDAKRFSRKVFCQNEVFKEDKEVFWLDADTLTLKRIPEDFLTGLVKDVPFCYLGRERFRTETGFLGFNTEHPDFQRFSDKYLSTYTSGRFMNLTAWEDTAVFDHARGKILGNNLNKSALQGIDHCWPHTVLGEYIEHFKGRRKFILGDGQRPDHKKVARA